jgi:hypothetical protein
MPRVRRLLLTALFFAAPAWAEATPAVESEAPPMLAAVLVTGEQTGPGLWTVWHGGNRLHLLGSMNPLPRRMRWKSDEVEALIAASQRVLAPPTVKIEPEIGRLRGLTLLPGLLAARRNPDKEKLAEQVSPELYARWAELKARHIPRNSAVEGWRPLFAVQKLYEEAVEGQGLRFRGQVWPVVEKAARRARVPVITPTATVSLADPRQAIREFRASELDDVECFALTLDRLEQDLATMRDRANAWAVGDIAWLRELPGTDPGPACIEAVLNSSVLSKRGWDELPARIEAAWLKEAEAALAESEQSFAVLPMRLLLADDGLLARLAERGYRIEEPL